MDEHNANDDDTLVVLVTGANSGLGFAICCRLMDEFLHTRMQSQYLVIIITTRNGRKGEDTAKRLRKHLRATINGAEESLPGVGKFLESRICIQQEILDLTSLQSVQALAQRLLQREQKINSVILNAGMGGWTSLAYGKAIYNILTDWIHATTWPTYKLSAVGTTTKPQIPEDTETTAEEPPLGEVFCANLLGHYMLAHYLTPLLKKNETGRMIWVSSLEAYAWSLQLDDFQSMKTRFAYEASKRITDVLALTSELPTTARWVEPYFSIKSANESTINKGHSQSGTHPRRRLKMYVCHPGICATSIMPMPYILSLAMIAVLYISRWIGSLWHTCTAYSGACAPVWLALSEQSTLDAFETKAGPGKWGSATDWMGNERVERTEVEGWGYSGVVEPAGMKKKQRKGRMRGAKDLTAEAKEEFMELGRKCWSEMEALRLAWEERLGPLESS